MNTLFFNYKSDFKVIACILLSFFFLYTTAQAQNTDGVAASGLSFNRTKLIQAINIFAYELRFKQEKDVKKQPCFAASDDKGEHVQLLGEENALTQIKWIFAFTSNNDSNLICFNRMSKFMQYIGDQKGADWFNKQLKQSISNPLSINVNDITLDSNQVAEFSYNPGSKTVTLTVTPDKS
jgi:hypothetical protein